MAGSWAKFSMGLSVALAVASCGPRTADAPSAPAAPTLIARADLLGDPARAGAQLSPAGDRVAFLAPRDGVVNLWVMPVGGAGEAQPLTDDRARGVRRFWWAHDNATLIYAQDNEGDENWRLFAIPAAGGEARPLTPAGARAELLGQSASDPGGLVVTLNTRDVAWPDVFRVDIATGARTLLQRNTNSPSVRGFTGFLVDRDNQVRLGLKTQADGSVEVLSRPARGPWSRLFTIPFEDARSSRPLAFEADGAGFLMLDSTGRDRAALVRVDAATGVKTVLGESARADVVDVWLDPRSNAPEAYGANYLRLDWRALDGDAQADLDFLDQQLAGDATIVSRSADDQRWIVVEEGPTTPPRSYVYDRADPANRRLTLLFRHFPALEQAALQPMIPVEIAARDGLTLVSYLTLPTGSDANNDARPDAPAPLVLLPHDGPWARDAYGFNALHQWLANRGYAALSVNFRGSAGFGKAFLNAGNREWGGRMFDDLADAAEWAVENGVAQRERVALLGLGFGGFAAQSGLAFAPDQFRCAVSFGGASNLIGLFDSAPPFLAAQREQFYLRVGDTRTPEGRLALRERSPISRAGAIEGPLLIVAGARDPYGARLDANAMAAALRGRGAAITYMVYPDEGRQLARAQNRLSFYAVAENFLSQCLGGRAEPVGASLQGANMEVYDGASRTPGLSAFARRPPATPAAVAAPGESPALTPIETLELEAPKPIAPPASTPAPPPSEGTPAPTQ